MVDEVERGHHQASAVTDDADVAREADVVEVVLFGLSLEVVRGSALGVLLQVRMSEQGVVVDVEDGVRRHHAVVLGEHQRVDLGVAAVVVVPQAVEGAQRCGHLAGDGVVDPCLRDRSPGLVGVEAKGGGDVFAGDSLGALGGNLLDVHAALCRDHCDRLALVAVHRHADVQFVRELDGVLDEHAVDVQPLHLAAEDALGDLADFRWRVGEVDAAGLAAATDPHLGLYRDRQADPFGGGRRLVDGGREFRVRYGQPRLREDLLCLVLLEFHRPRIPPPGS